MAYFVVWWIWSFWILAATRYPTEPSEPLRLIGASEFAAVSALNGVFLLALLFDGYRSLRSPPRLRRAHFAGLLLAVATLALVQLGALHAHAPISGR